MFNPFSVLGPKTQCFICGCGHSGTTLIANILSAHPKIYIPLHEPGTFMRQSSEWRRYIRLVFLAALSRRPVLVEKTPRHVHKIDHIRERVKGVRFVIPVRDGRDSAASMRNRYGNVERAINRWIEDNTAVLAQRGKPDVLIYRHEDLIDDPPKMVRAICDFIGVEYSDDLLNYHSRERLWFKQDKVRHTDGVGEDSHNALRNWQVNQPIFDNRGRWRKELSEDDVAELTRGPGAALMKAFGYL